MGRSTNPIYFFYLQPNFFYIETRFGYVDVKSFPVHFYIQRNGGFGGRNTAVTFELEQLNVGGTMKTNTGVFTAPRSGIYHFSFAFMNYFQNNVNSIYIRINGVAIGCAHTDGSSKMLLKSSLPATLTLKSGDMVDLFQVSDGNIFDNPNHYTHFNGFLIEENIDEKFNILQLPSSSGVVKSADPVCLVKGFPKNCQDLSCRGHTFDGFYLVRSDTLDNKIDTIYCEFSQYSSTRSITGGLLFRCNLCINSANI